MNPKRVIGILIIILSITTSLFAVYFQWDEAPMEGGAQGPLGLKNLDLDKDDLTGSDYDVDTYKTGEWHNSNWATYLGRLVYQGAPNTVYVTNNGLPAGIAGLNNFYYTRVTNVNQRAQVFFVATLKGIRHDGVVERVETNNDLIVDQNDTINFTKGAGLEEIDNPGSEEGYNDKAQKGTTVNHKYKYPYRILWADFSVVRASKGTGNHPYESFLYFEGDGISATVELAGYTKGSSGQPDTYFFSVERIVPDPIPFDMLVQRDSLGNRLPVGMVRFNSSDMRAKIQFASNSQGDAIDFKFTSGDSSFPYSVVFQSIQPSGSAQKIMSTDDRFPITSSMIAFTSPITGESVNQYILEGELSIYVDQQLKSKQIVAGDYTTEIYCKVTSW